MEITITPLRAGLLIVFLATFAILGGFTPPSVHLETDGMAANVNRSWFYCMAMFVAGAGMATIVDHWVGMMPPSNLRPIYVIGGVLLMVVSTIWYRSMLGSWAEQLGPG